MICKIYKNRQAMRKTVCAKIYSYIMSKIPKQLKVN